MDNIKTQEEIPTEKTEGEEKLYTVRHNKEDVKLTLDELLKNAGKGLDYDRIRPSHDFLKSLAQKNGDGDVSHFITKMKNEFDTATAETSTTKENTAENSRETEMIKKEYPQCFQNGEITLPDEVKTLCEQGMNVVEAFHAADLKKTREQNAKLEAMLAAKNANAENAAVSIGSLSFTDAPEKSFYSSDEWDKLPSKQKEKFIKNGKIFEFMKKWSVK
jgi:hypothetical protein